MLVVKKIDGNMIEIDNTITGTPLRVPTHWLQIGEPIKEGDVIKFIKDEVNTRRLEKRKEEFEARLNKFD